MKHKTLSALGAAAAAVAAFFAASTGAHAATFSTIHVYNGTDGRGPNELIENAGYYYGTSSAGGAYLDNGAILKISKTTGAVTVLYSFNGTTGSRPYGALVRNADGTFYGTASTAGTYNGGVAFKMTAAGAVTFIHQFGAAGEGSLPTSLALGNDGNLYGTTTYGGANGKGTLFKMTTAGVVTTLHSFNGTDGSNPQGQLISTGNGVYYGTAFGGGAGDCGTYYKITNAGTFTLLYTFPKAAPAGCQPQGRLNSATDGRMWGTTQMGGASNAGTVFALSTAGVPTWVYSFTGGADGRWPHGGVTQANNFAFYGTTGYGSTYGLGTTFKITLSGVFTTLHAFDPAMTGETTAPHQPLLLDSSGNLIGSTPGYSQSTNGGSSFRQTP